MIFLLLFVLFLFEDVNSYKITFSKFIRKKNLEYTFSGDNDTIEILESIKNSALHIKKYYHYHF